MPQISAAMAACSFFSCEKQLLHLCYHAIIADERQGPRLTRIHAAGMDDAELTGVWEFRTIKNIQ
jgi:hypothetical protein